MRLALHEARSDAVGGVIARVRLWGVTIECDEGWRAELAYPESLFVLDGLLAVDLVKVVDAVAGLGRYGAPVLPLPGDGREAILRSLEGLGGPDPGTRTHSGVRTSVRGRAPH
jgi:hypothetical protein